MPAGATKAASVNIPLREAADLIECDYHTLRRKAVIQKEFTVIRDGVGRGFRVKLKRAEVEVYIRGGLPALRRFRKASRNGE